MEEYKINHNKSFNCHHNPFSNEIILKLGNYIEIVVNLKESLSTHENEKLLTKNNLNSSIEEISTFKKTQKILLKIRDNPDNDKYEIYKNESLSSIVFQLIPNNLTKLCVFSLKEKTQTIKPNWKEILLKSCIYFLRKNKFSDCFLLECDDKSYSTKTEILANIFRIFEIKSQKFEELHFFLENETNIDSKMPKRLLPLILSSIKTLKHLSIYFQSNFYFEENNRWKLFCDELNKLMDFEELEDLTFCLESDEKISNNILVALGFFLKFLFLYHNKISKLAFYFSSHKLNCISLESFAENIEIILPKMTECSLCLEIEYSQYFNFQLDKILLMLMNGLSSKLKRFTLTLIDEDFNSDDSIYFTEESLDIILEGFSKTYLAEMNLALQTNPNISNDYWKKFFWKIAKQQKMLLYSNLNLSKNENVKKMMRIYAKGIKERIRYFYIAYILKKKVKNICGRNEPLCEILDFLFIKKNNFL